MIANLEKAIDQEVTTYLESLVQDYEVISWLESPALVGNKTSALLLVVCWPGKSAAETRTMNLQGKQLLVGMMNGVQAQRSLDCLR